MTFIKEQFLPKPPAEMTDEHIENAIGFHMRGRDNALSFVRRHEESVARLKATKIPGHAYALDQLRAEKLKRAGRKISAEVALKARMKDTINLSFACDSASYAVYTPRPMSTAETE